MPNGSLNLSNNVLRAVGKPPYDVVFTLKLAEAVLSLKPVGPWSIAFVLSNLTDQSLASFQRLVKLDDTLAETYFRMQSAHPAIANLTQKQWPKLKYEDIAEETIVDCAPVMQIVFTIDGERLVTDKYDDYNALMTFDEFQRKYKRSVSDHIHAAGERKILNLQRVMQLVDAEIPVTYTVNLASEEGIFPSRQLKLFSEEQIVMYAKRCNATVLDHFVASK